MPKPKRRRAKTLSISLTPELFDAVDDRVQTGLYTSASELIREALRLLLRKEPDAPSPGAQRFESAAELMQFGLELRARKLREAEPGLTEAEVQQRLRELSDQQETGPGLRISHARLKKLKTDK